MLQVYYYFIIKNGVWYCHRIRFPSPLSTNSVFLLSPTVKVSINLEISFRQNVQQRTINNKIYEIEEPSFHFSFKFKFAKFARIYQQSKKIRAQLTIHILSRIIQLKVLIT